MRRHLLAFARLRWRILLHGIVSAKRRDGMERLSRLVELAVPLMLGLVLAPAALGLGALGFLAGTRAVGVDWHPALVLLARLALLGVTAGIVLTPLLRSAQGPAEGFTRLLLLPIPQRALFTAQVGSGLADPWLLLIAPAVLLFPVGLAFAGRPVLAAVALVAGAGALASLAALGALASFLMQLLFRDRRRREALMLILIALLSAAGFLPALLDPDRRARAAAGEAPAAPRTAIRLTAPRLVTPLPTDLYVLSAQEAARGRPARAALPALGALLWAAGAAFAGSRVFRRLLEEPEGGAWRKRTGPSRLATRPLPGLSPAASAIARSTSRFVLRTVRGKMGVWLSPFFGILIAWILMRLPEGGLPGGLPFGPLVAAAAALFALLGQQPHLLNAWAVDGPGLTLQFLAPVTERELVAGKIAGGLLLFTRSAAIALGLGVLAGPAAPPALWPAVALAMVSTYLPLAAAGALLSTLLPKTSDLNQMGKAGNPHGLSGIVATLLTPALAGPPLGLVALGLFVLRSPAIALVLVALYTVFCALGVRWGVGLVAAAVAGRRENLALVAAGR